MTKRTVFTTTAILSLCGLVTACGAEVDDGDDAVVVSAAPDGVEVQRAKWSNLVLKQGAQAEAPGVEPEEIDVAADGADEDADATNNEATSRTIYGPIIKIKPKG